jgi:oxygen-independent coproporphyrinogen-3 oxidase
LGALLDENRLPLYRGLRMTPHQRLVRELILQLKRGKLDAAYFRRKFNIEILDDWQSQFQAMVDDGAATIDGDRVRLTRQGLLEADALLPAFFEPEHQGVRYT